MGKLTDTELSKNVLSDSDMKNKDVIFDYMIANGISSYGHNGHKLDMNLIVRCDIILHRPEGFGTEHPLDDMKVIPFYFKIMYDSTHKSARLDDIFETIKTAPLTQTYMIRDKILSYLEVWYNGNAYIQGCCVDFHNDVYIREWNVSNI